MKEKLIIKNFGPIKDIELDLGRFTILIGEQATGKSTVAKVLAVCRYFSYIIGHKGSKPPGNFAPSFSDGLAAWGLSEYRKEDTLVKYSNANYTFSAKAIGVEVHRMHTVENKSGNDLVFSEKLEPVSDQFIKLLAELDKITAKISSAQSVAPWTIPTSFYLNDVAAVLDNPFYLPTQRGLQSIFDIGRNSIQNLASSLFNQLSKMDSIARAFANETYIEPLNIYYKNVRGHGYVRKAEETEYYSLYDAASGYQSIIPIILAIEFYADKHRKPKTFLIEEPEQNLFPKAQHSLMRFLVEKSSAFGNSIFLTTQSPYILTSLNNMMYAYQVGLMDAQKTGSIVDKRYWINPDEVSAYMMNTDGTCENIMDSEGLIKAEKTDEISSVINSEFDELMNIEIGV